MSSDSTTHRANFLEYHRSLASELDAIKNRIRFLTPHRATSGAFKEAALRSVLRRHLPESLMIATGFIVNRNQECSTQIDLLLVDRNHPTLFKDGDLVIATPSAVRGIIEVKSTLTGLQEIGEASTKVAECKALCSEWPGSNRIFTGIYVYDGNVNQCQNIIAAAKNDHNNRLGWIRAICHGTDVIGLYCDDTHLPDGTRLQRSWCSWETPGLAPAYFISTILGQLNEHDVMFNPAAWNPAQPENRLRYYVDMGSNQIREISGSEADSNE